ncbi:MAG: peptidoglycan DD-metalloendopeptidase family protein [Rhodospirillales bacterium]|nr:peptidoglycan DD-metalloendopeptidase family protein [Alphaproteobacteria bacterium]USO04217.1 MAG: peptidoglycan DD-metalloendopeptidase family protein [Rhodospirillales bacterium]
MLKRRVVTFLKGFCADAGSIAPEKLKKNCPAVLSFLGRILRLRQRHVLTRSGYLRLRYIVAPAVLFLVVSSPFFTSLASSPDGLRLYGQTGENSQIAGRLHPPENFSSRLNASLYGQLSSVSAIARSIPQPVEKIVTVKPGDSLGIVMEHSGVGGTEADQIIKAMKANFDPRHLKAGQDVHMHFVPEDGGGMRFARMKIPLDSVKTLIVYRGAEGFSSKLHEKEVEKVARAQKTNIEVSLYGSAAKAGIPKSVVTEAIRIYSWNVDFQRDVRKGDGLEVLYDSFETDNGHVVKTGDILYAKLTLNGKELPLYRYEMADGRVGYFGADGQSLKRTLMTTPIDGARMSSGFGMRRHPVLGYSKMHKGMDFAAATGTPIYAAGDGVVEKAGRFSSYGKYVRIRHNSELKTAYAHMSKIKTRVGARVTQGQVIGYVGTTGRSTGPHLHYEVLKNGQQINPRSVNLPTGEKLTGQDMKKFKSEIKKIDERYARLVADQKYADGQKEKKHYN